MECGSPCDSWELWSVSRDGMRRSHCPGGQALFVHASQSLGGGVDHLPAGHAGEGLVPVCAADVGHASLQNLPDRHQQTGPAQVIVWRSQRLCLRRTAHTSTKHTEFSDLQLFVQHSVFSELQIICFVLRQELELLQCCTLRGSVRFHQATFQSLPKCLYDSHV